MVVQLGSARLGSAELVGSRPRRQQPDERGFSLIELLVVVVILGILIAIAIPIYLNYEKAAQKRSLEADVRDAIPVVTQCMFDGTPPWEGDCDEYTDHLAVSPGHSVVAKADSCADDCFVIVGSATDPAWWVCYHSDAPTAIVRQATECT